MASIRHSTPKISAYSMYTRNKKLADMSGKTGISVKPAIQAKTRNANMVSSKSPSPRKRKSDTNENAQGTSSKEQTVQNTKGKKKKIVQEETPIVENSHSGGVQEVKIEYIEEENRKENEGSSYFQPSVSEIAVSPQRPSVISENEVSEEAFKWLLKPVNPEVFFETKYERQPFVIKRYNSDYYNGLFSTKEFEKITKENYLNYDQEIDVVAYIDGERKTIVNDKRVLPSFLWSVYKDGYSIRMRNPQVYHKALGSLCSLLQEYFTSYVGANMYLTPAGTQGFPPHFDDIDAFILQIEGKKLWKLYAPSHEDLLARQSSPDLDENYIGEPCMEVELNAGDMLYFPRGYIHQAMAAPDEHSMHITISTNQLNTWGDYLERAFTNALELALAKDIEFRRSLPKDYFDFMGFAHSDNKSKERQNFIRKANTLISKCVKHVSLDFAADEHAVDFVNGSMPPYLSEKEKSCSVFGNGARFIKGKTFVSSELNLRTKIRLIRRKAFRLVVDDEGAKLFHSLCNTKNHKEKEVTCIEIDFDNVPAISSLFRTHPDYIKIQDLPCRKSEMLLPCLQQMYDNGFLMTEEPLPLEG